MPLPLFNNPVEAGFVEKEEDWLHRIARNYHGLKALIDLILIEPQGIVVS
jgi:hypothetical protein